MRFSLQKTIQIFQIERPDGNTQKIHGENLKLIGHVISLIPCKNSSLLLLTEACVQCSVPACAFCYFLSLMF